MVDDDKLELRPDSAAQLFAPSLAIVATSNPLAHRGLITLRRPGSQAVSFGSFIAVSSTLFTLHSFSTAASS
jgi:hypothetical protein